jgi:hypothetical protein
MASPTVGRGPVKNSTFGGSERCPYPPWAGDQTNQRSCQRGIRVRFRCSLPPAFMTQISAVPSRLLTNAILPPPATRLIPD